MSSESATCKWKFRNFSCEFVRLKAQFPARLISRFSSFRTQFLKSSGRGRLPATTRRPHVGLGLLCILALLIESIPRQQFPPFSLILTVHTTSTRRPPTIIFLQVLTQLRSRCTVVPLPLSPVTPKPYPSFTV